MKNKKAGIETLSLIVGLVIFYGVLHLVGITCPIKAVTGISCPGCGMTRAWLSFIRLDIQSAFYYHPLFLLPLIGLIMYIFRDHIPERVLRAGLYLSVVLFFTVYIYRMTQCNDIVVFQPKESIVYRVLKFVGYY